MSFAAASSTASEREERVFTAAFGIMDSSQDGEAVAAFMRVRELLHRHGSGFRRLLERCHEAERLNEELGRQNAELLRENAALRARDSRRAPSATTIAQRLFFVPPVPGRHWDVGLMVIVAVWAAFGLLGATTAFGLAAAILIGAAILNRFSPFRLFAGAFLAFAAYATGAPAPATPARPTSSAYATAVATVTPQPAPARAPAAPTASFVRPASPAALSPAATAPIAMTATTAASVAPTRQPDVQPLAQTFADPPQRPRAAPDLPRRSSAEQRPRHAARVDCGSYRLQPGFNCARGGGQWRHDSFLEFEPSLDRPFD